jgi:hypothetical protein
MEFVENSRLKLLKLLTWRCASWSRYFRNSSAFIRFPLHLKGQYSVHQLKLMNIQEFQDQNASIHFLLGNIYSWKE